MNAWKRGLLVGGTLIALALAAGVFVRVRGMALAREEKAAILQWSGVMTERVL